MSDVTFLVGETKFHLHKTILAARNDYFRAMLFGGLAETAKEVITIGDTTAEGFQQIVHFLYAGKIDVLLLDKDLVLEILCLSHRYGIDELVRLVSRFLKSTLHLRDVSRIYNHANMFDLEELVATTCEFMDRNAKAVLASDDFLHLSASALVDLVERNSFCADEMAIFTAVSNWCNFNNVEGDAASKILRCVRLPLIGMKVLLNKVRPLGLASPDLIMDAISLKVESRDMDLPHRGFIYPERNVATMTEGARVVEGECANFLLDDKQPADYTLDKGFCRHMISETHDSEKSITIKLNQQTIINNIKLLLWDKDERAYSYYIDVSVDGKDYVRLIDYSAYHCRSWQNLYFEQRVVRFIRIVGTQNTANNVFHLVTVEAYYRDEIVATDKNGIIVPTENVACVKAGATVVEGVSRTRDTLISGQLGEYDWEQGYTCHQLGVGSIVVQLAQPYVLTSMRLLLWDCDDRSYTFDVSVSNDRKNWKLVVRRDELSRSWQYMEFESQTVVYFQIVGTHNTANEVFHAVHFESPAQPETESLRPSREHHHHHHRPPSDHAANESFESDEQ